MAASRQHSQVRLSSVLSLLVVLVVVAVCGVGVAEARDRHEPTEWSRRIYLDGQMHRGNQRQGHGHQRSRSRRPNIILILTDDQDVLLGSLKVMPKLKEHMTQQGAFFNNTFVSTPMCCPSRSSILTGMYVHNHNVYTNNDNCSSPMWVREHEPHTFGAYLQSGGYRTGYFGKYLNKYNGSYTPAGWDKWVGLVRNSRFYNYTLSNNGRLQKHYDNYYNDYLTDKIANDSVAFFRRSRRLHSSKPVMMVLSVPAPHGPEDAAPQYQHMFVNNSDHRTPSWNVAPNYDKQWLLSSIAPMTPQYKIFTDLLQRRRLQTLQSVDDLVEKVYKELAMLGELDNTYVMYTSDHGYHLGQFGLIKGKSMAYDFDTRVPLMVTGPGIKAGSRISNMAVSVDIAPTLLDMGGVRVPERMDGVSLLPLMKATHDSSRTDRKDFIKTTKPWRDSILLERGKLSKKMLIMVMRNEKQTLIEQNQKNLHLYLPPKQQKIMRQCLNPKKSLQLPCKPEQKWYCAKDTLGKMRLHKCRHSNREREYDSNTVLMQRDQPQMCRCSDGNVGMLLPSSYPSHPTTSLSRRQRHRHRRFLRRQARKKARGRLVRQRRSVMRDAVQFGGSGGTVLPLGSSSGFDLFTRRCRILMNNTVSCDQDLYRDHEQWEMHRERLDEMIKEYRKILEDLRNIREHLISNQPPLFIDSEEDKGKDDLDTELGLPSSGESCYCENDTLARWGLSEQVERHRERFLRREQRQQRRAQRQEQKHRRGQKKKEKKKANCNNQRMKCFSHDNNHWKTPPFWEYGPFCFCSNANNNTYWCIRTINTTHDFLYCEYITGFISFYDMLTDPFQLHNEAKKLNYGVLQQLHDQLAVLKSCQGRESCDLQNYRDARIPVHAKWDDGPYYGETSGAPDGYSISYDGISADGVYGESDDDDPDFF